MAAPNIVSGALPQEQEYMLTLPVGNLANITANETIKVLMLHPFKVLDVRWRTGETTPTSSGTPSYVFKPQISGTDMTCGTITLDLETGTTIAACGAGATLKTSGVSAPITGANTGTANQAIWIKATSVTTSTNAFSAGNGWFEIDVINTGVGANYPSAYSAG